MVEVGLPYFAGTATPNTSRPMRSQGASTIVKVPAVRLRLGKAGEERQALVATVFDLQAAQYGIDRGLGSGAAKDLQRQRRLHARPGQESITGVPRDQVITVARQFALTCADKTHGKSMVIIGAAMNHWYHADMNYRGVINLLMMCGCIGQSGGGWAHYVGQEKLRPQTGWVPLAFATGLGAPAAPDEQHQLLLRPHRPVALREAGDGGDRLAAWRTRRCLRRPA